MPVGALGLLLTAAVLHAGWNVLVKRAQQRLIFTWWALTVAPAVCLPSLFFLGGVPGRAWPFIVASALAEAAYFFALTQAYRLGDFTVVYPIARGAAPALLAVWAALFLGQHPSAGGLAGLLLLLAGLALVGSRAWWAERGTLAQHRTGIAAALLVALCISIYSIIDGTAVHFASVLLYTIIVLNGAALLSAPVVFQRYGGRAVAREWRANWPSICLVGALSLITYLLVLTAYSMAPVGYAGAIRETSIVFAALLGWRWLGEPFGRGQAAGIVAILAGIALITLLG
jgi:drug/metabolite transporter (DMT)-like permease